MNYGDAFNDMPEGYRKYRAEHAAVTVDNGNVTLASEIWGGNHYGITYEYEKEPKPEQSEAVYSQALTRMSKEAMQAVVNDARQTGATMRVERASSTIAGVYNGYYLQNCNRGFHLASDGGGWTVLWEDAVSVEIVDTEPSNGQSEADKAIADGKPRWIHHDQLGWQYVIFTHREDWRYPKPLLVYREAVEKASAIHESPLMLVNTDVEILPHGETPPADPEDIPEWEKKGDLQPPIDFLRSRMEYNAKDFGVEGKYIRLEYVYNYIDEYERRLAGTHQGYTDRMRLALESVWDSDWRATLDEMDEDIFEVKISYETRDLVQLALKIGE